MKNLRTLMGYVIGVLFGFVGADAGEVAVVADQDNAIVADSHYKDNNNSAKPKKQRNDAPKTVVKTAALPDKKTGERGGRRKVASARLRRRYVVDDFEGGSPRRPSPSGAAQLLKKNTQQEAKAVKEPGATDHVQEIVSKAPVATITDPEELKKSLESNNRKQVVQGLITLCELAKAGTNAPAELLNAAASVEKIQLVKNIDPDVDLSPYSLADGLRLTPHLRELRIEGATLKCIPFPLPEKLEKLFVGNNDFSGMKDEDWKQLAPLGRLYVIELSRVGLVKLPSCLPESLEWLGFSFNDFSNITDAEWESLLKPLKKLSYLRVAFACIKRPMSYVPDLVEDLRLSGNDFTGASSEEMASIFSHANLRHVSFWRCKFGTFPLDAATASNVEDIELGDSTGTLDDAAVKKAGWEGSLDEGFMSRNPKQPPALPAITPVTSPGMLQEYMKSSQPVQFLRAFSTLCDLAKQGSSAPADMLKAVASIEKIYFKGFAGADLSTCVLDDALSLLPNLRDIQLLNAGLTKLPSALPKNIEVLVLDGNNFADVDAQQWKLFENLEKLRTLSFKASALKSPPICLTGVAQVDGWQRDLDLEGNDFSAVSDEVWTQFALNKISTLNLINTKLKCLPAHLPALLEVLHLSTDNFDEVGADGWQPLKSLVKLKMLVLSGAGLKSIPNYVPESLNTLGLHCDNLTEVKDEVWNSLANLTHLRELQLCGMRLKKLPACMPPSLTTLDLGEGDFSSMGEDGWRPLAKLVNLTDLTVGYCRLTVPPTSLPDSLRSLYLRGDDFSKVTDAQLAALCSPKNLASLYLYDCKLQHFPVAAATKSKITHLDISPDGDLSPALHREFVAAGWKGRAPRFYFDRKI